MQRGFVRRLGWARGTVFVAVLGLLLQFGPPVAAQIDPLLALGSICHADGRTDQPQAPVGSAHEHCVFCQLAPAGFTPADMAGPPPPRMAMLLRPLPLRPTGARSLDRPAYRSRAPPPIG